MASTSFIIISREAIENNVRFLQAQLSAKTRISAVIKGNAYGHGTSCMVRILEGLGIDHFSVFSSAEARDAYSHSSEKSTMMIMGYVDEQDMDWIIENNIEFFVSDLKLFTHALSRASETGEAIRIHIDLETGMHRTGLNREQLDQVIDMIHENRDLIDVKGVCSHFAGAESIANYSRIKEQFYSFNKLVEYIQERGISGFSRHISSSAAIINYPEAQLDMVRAGIILYGYWPTRETQIKYLHLKKDKTDPLKRALSWYSHAMQIKDVPEGDFIGYGLSYQTDRDLKTMVVPVGYCNGYSRSLSNNGHVLINGQRSPVIGMVNMNMFICDITEIPEVNVQDEIILIGKQNGTEITFSSFADMNKAMNYEILARLPENIERTIS